MAQIQVQYAHDALEPMTCVLILMTYFRTKDVLKFFIYGMQIDFSYVAAWDFFTYYICETTVLKHLNSEYRLKPKHSLCSRIFVFLSRK